MGPSELEDKIYTDRKKYEEGRTGEGVLWTATGDSERVGVLWRALVPVEFWKQTEGKSTGMTEQS